MNALDTNVLVRYLVSDDPKQAARARALVDALDANDERAWVSDIVLCELVWVLRSAYGFDRAEIAEAMARLISARQLAFEHGERISRALAAYAHGAGDFADYLIREQARAAGCSAVMTFDKKLLSEPMFAAPR